MEEDKIYNKDENVRNDIKAPVTEDVESPSSGEVDESVSGGFFNRKLFNGWMTPGLAILLLTALFAIYKIVDVILYFTR